MIDERTLTLAFSAGMVATVNPCGFAMLPAYLSYFLGLEDRSADPRAGVFRALRVGLAVSTGFMVVFFAMGVAFNTFTQSITEHLPWMTILFGIALAILGVAMLRGYQPVLSLPKLEKGTKNRELSSMFLFGVSYAVSSLACTIGVFVYLVATTFTKNSFGQGMLSFVAYALGMALVLMVLTLAIALAKASLVRSIRRVLPHINRLSGGLLVVAGAYLTYYGFFERASNESPATPPGGPARIVFNWNSELTNWINQTDPRRIGIVLATIIAVSVLLATAWRAPTGSKHGR